MTQQPENPKIPYSRVGVTVNVLGHLPSGLFPHSGEAETQQWMTLSSRPFPLKQPPPLSMLIGAEPVIRHPYVFQK